MVIAILSLTEKACTRIWNPQIVTEHTVDLKPLTDGFLTEIFVIIPTFLLIIVGIFYSGESAEAQAISFAIIFVFCTIFGCLSCLRLWVNFSTLKHLTACLFCTHETSPIKTTSEI